MQITVREVTPTDNDVVIDGDEIRAERYLRSGTGPGNAFIIYKKDDGAFIANREWKDADLTRGQTVALFAYMDQVTRQYLGTTFDAALTAHRKHNA